MRHRWRVFGDRMDSRRGWCVSALLLAGVVALLALGVMSAEATGPGTIRPPFPQGDTWYVCQGYNGSISHSGKPDLDLTVASNGNGSTGCTPATNNASTGRAVTSPGAGSVVYRDTALGFLCVNLSGGGSVGLGHMAGMVGIGSVSAGQQIGTVAGPNVVGNGGYAHIHMQTHTGTGCGSSPRVSLTQGNGFQLCGSSDLPYSGAVNQYSGLAITNPTGSSCSTTPPPTGDVKNAALYGPTEGWRYVVSSYGYGGNYHWSYGNLGNPRENWAVWTWGTKRGSYEAQCYIPGRDAGATVKYQIVRRGGSSWVTKNQNALTGWTSLGTFSFDGVPKIVLGDETATAYPTQFGVDACKLILKKAATPPSAPTGVAANAGNALAGVSWSASSSDGGSTITKYEVTSSPGGKTCSTSASGRSCTVTGLTNGTSYTFYVRARNAIGLSSASATNAVTPKAPFTPPSCRGETATLWGSAAGETIYGTAGDDVIVALGGADTIYGYGGRDIICAGPGADTIYGGAGRDKIYGNGGTDTIYGGRGNDKIEGGLKADTLKGGDGLDTIYGGRGGDTLRGGNHADKLYGNAGSDRLGGDGGSPDVCNGGVATDTHVGGCETMISIP